MGGSLLSGPPSPSKKETPCAKPTGGGGRAGGGGVFTESLESNQNISLDVSQTTRLSALVPNGGGGGLKNGPRDALMISGCREKTFTTVMPGSRGFSASTHAFSRF